MARHGGVECGLQALERGPSAESGARPGKACAVFKLLDGLLGGVGKREFFAAIAEFAGHWSEGFQPEFFFQGGGILGHDEEPAGAEHGAGRESVLIEGPAREVGGGVAGVVQLDEFQRAGIRRVEMDLIDHHRAVPKAGHGQECRQTFHSSAACAKVVALAMAGFRYFASHFPKNTPVCGHEFPPQLDSVICFALAEPRAC
jgi:hypothetical protein